MNIGKGGAERATPQEGLLRPRRRTPVGLHSTRAHKTVGSRDGSIRYVEYCPSCGDFNWGCLGCGTPTGIHEIARAGKGAEKLFRESRVLEPWELNALISACVSPGGASGIRDAAMIALLCQARIQAAELVALDLEDWDCERRILNVKGRTASRPRLAWIDLAVSGALERWISVRGCKPGSLFVNLHSRNGMSHCEPIGKGAVYMVLRTRSKRAGIEYVRPADLHGASLRTQTGTKLEGSSHEENTRAIILSVVDEGSVRRDHQHAELAAAAKSLASLRPVDKGGPGPLNSLSKKELTRLKNRVDAILLRRQVDEIEG